MASPFSGMWVGVFSKIVAVLAIAGAVACTPGSKPSAVAEGKPFPDVPLLGVDGRDAVSSGYRGRVLILNVWATWCPPCRREMPSLERLSRALDASRFAVVGLSVDDDLNLLREFMGEHGIGFAMYSDPGRRVSEGKLGVRAYPMTFVVGPDGVLLRRIIGEREWDSPAMMSWITEIHRSPPSRAAITAGYW